MTYRTPADNPANWPAALADEMPVLRSRLIPAREFLPHVIRDGRYHPAETQSLEDWRQSQRRTASMAAVAARRELVAD